MRKSRSGRYARVIAASILVTAVSTPVTPLGLADNLTPIVWGGVVKLSAQTDHTFDRSADHGSLTNTYSEPEVEWYANFGQHFSLNGLFKMEQVRDPDSTGWFQDEGLWTDQLYATVALDPVRIYVGKIHPRFGVAWDVAPGLYGTDLAEDYEIAEKIGFGAALDVRRFGLHTLAVEAFQADTSFLSNSVINRPRIDDPRLVRVGRARLSDGGIGNTGSPDNYAVTLRGGGIPRLDGLSYNVGVATQRGSDVGGELDERSYVAGLQWEFPLTSRITVVPIFEWARVENQGGADLRADYYTAGAAFELGLGWSVSLHTTLKPVEDNAVPDHRTDRMFGASIGYDLGGVLKRKSRLLEGLGLEAGVKREDIEHASQNTVGFAVVDARSF